MFLVSDGLCYKNKFCSVFKLNRCHLFVDQLNFSKQTPFSPLSINSWRPSDPFMHQWTRPSLTRWGRMTRKCISELTIIGSYNGLLPAQCQAIIWTNIVNWTLRKKIVIKIRTFSFTKKLLKVSSTKWQPFCLGLYVLTFCGHYLNQCWLLINKSSHIRLRTISQEIPQQSIAQIVWKLLS